MKKITKALVNKHLINIHRGFMTDRGKEYSDQEILDNVPKNHLTWKHIGEDERIQVLAPFTYKWVHKQLKKNPHKTAYEMVVEAGFKDQVEVV